MASGVMSLAGTSAPTRGSPAMRYPASRPVLSDRSSLHLHPASSAISAARALTSCASSCFSGVCFAPRIGFRWEVSQRNGVVKVRAGKPALGCTKRSRSRKSVARAQGFRVRISYPGGRNVLRRRRAKGRKILCPCTNPNRGPHA